jgi:hypothetical protein
MHAKQTSMSQALRSTQATTVPEKPWNSISMDFKQLPVSSKFTAILVIIDRFTKQAIFVPTTDKVTLQDLAHLFVLHVFSKHGILLGPTSTTSLPRLGSEGIRMSRSESSEMDHSQIGNPSMSRSVDHTGF